MLPKALTQHVPLIPSPAIPLVKLSSQLMLACASFTTTGWPSCNTLCIVIRALNVCTSSARMGWLSVENWGNQSTRLVGVLTGNSIESSVRRPTLSCQPKRTERICGPMYIQCMRERVSLFYVSHEAIGIHVELIWRGSSRLGAVSSEHKCKSAERRVDLSVLW